MLFQGKKESLKSVPGFRRKPSVSPPPHRRRGREPVVENGPVVAVAKAAIGQRYRVPPGLPDTDLPESKNAGHNQRPAFLRATNRTRTKD